VQAVALVGVYICLGMTSPDNRLRNNVKDKLARGETVYSMTVRLVRGVEIAGIARAAGFDSIYIDLEHSGFSLETVGQISIASLGIGIAPFVRVPSPDRHFITRVLDAGALGIIVPDLHSADEARAVVRAAKYRPIGDRSLPGVMSQLTYRSMTAADACNDLNDATMVIAMIESQAGLAEVNAIAAVQGIDILLVGANDLCSANGVPGQFDHELVQSAFGQVHDACQIHHKTLGIGGLASRPDLVKKYVALGGRYVSLGADLSLLVAAATQKRKEVS